MDQITANDLKCDFFNDTNNEEIQFRCRVANEWVYGLINNGNTDLNASLPVILLLHDWAGNKQGPHRMFVKLARWLAGNKFRVVRFDFRGRGESTGRTSSTTYHSMMQDVITIHQMSKQVLNANQIYLLGFCSGATLAIYYSLHFPGIDGTILLSIVPAETSSNNGVWNLLNLVPFEDKSNKSTQNPMQQKSLLIFGNNDPEYEKSLKYYTKLFKKLQVYYNVEIIAGANHGFFSTKWENDIFRTIKNWLCNL